MKTNSARVLVAAIAGVLLLAGCGVGSEPNTDEATDDSSAGVGTDDSTPSAGGGEAYDLDAAVEASRDESTLVVYGNPSSDQWDPVLEDFHETYPWIEVETFDLGGAEAFQRYLSEEATGAETADMIVNTDGAGWLDLVDRGQVQDLTPPELADLGDEAVLAPGVFALSYDPLVGVFNSQALPEDEQPTSLAELAEMAEDLDGRIGTVAVENANAGLGTYGFLDENGEEGWEVLEQLGPHTGAEEGTGALLSKLQSGEYEAAFFVSGSVRALIDGTDTGDILDYRYFEDATALPARGMGVTTAADSPASAEVLISWLLSEEGQTSACGGGFTPYREGVDCPTGLPAIEDAVGEGGAILVGYPEGLAEEQAEIQERWNEAFGR
jgi:iron(III) transport system substrate-binding protein